MLKIARVDWYDARSVDGWCMEKNFDENLSLIHSAGYLFKETEKAVFLAAGVSPDLKDGNMYCCTIVIPKLMITHIETLCEFTPQNNLKQE